MESTELTERSEGAVMAAPEMEAPQRPAGTMIALIERIVMNPDLPIERLERMLALQEAQQLKADKAEFADAKARAMHEMPDIPKSGHNRHNDTRYSTLHDITSTTRPVLGKHGLSLGFDVKVDERVHVTARLVHRNGYEESTTIPLPFDKSGSKNEVQSIGSSQTYGQRYTAQAILGLSMDDATENDGANQGYITDEQVTELQELLAANGVKERDFLAFAKIDSLGQVYAQKFNAAKAAIVQRGNANA